MDDVLSRMDGWDHYLLCEEEKDQACPGTESVIMPKRASFSISHPKRFKETPLLTLKTRSDMDEDCMTVIFKVLRKQADPLACNSAVVA